ncbi:hypothetical protein [Kitasatospora sp. NPDC002965]|uniref:hypothetical protein n=1 Tax=Kitasatospora sp. NPDC002965 TaxID=3154775 RepID=UPI00339F35A8
MNEPTAGPPDDRAPAPDPGRGPGSHFAETPDLDEFLHDAGVCARHSSHATRRAGKTDRATAIDLLLAERENTPAPADTPAGGPGYAAALRRIAADVARHRAGRYRRPAWWADYNRARLGLDSLSRSALTGPKALGLLARFAEEEGGETQLVSVLDNGRDTDIEIVGARIFGCLLHLAGHPVSACFWWKIAAGAGDRIAAFAIYLQHLERGEFDEAEYWFAQGCLDPDGETSAMPPGLPDMPGYFRAVPAVMVPWHTAENAGPAAGLADEVDRLVVHTDSGDGTVIDGVVRRPGPRLASRLEDLAGR